MYPGTESADGVRGGGVERAGRSRPSGGDDTAEGAHLGLPGAIEGQECDPVVWRVSRLAPATVLGQPLLGGGVLCWDGGVGRREDTEVCKISRTAGAKAGGVPL